MRKFEQAKIGRRRRRRRRRDSRELGAKVGSWVVGAELGVWWGCVEVGSLGLAGCRVM